MVFAVVFSCFLCYILVSSQLCFCAVLFSLHNRAHLSSVLRSSLFCNASSVARRSLGGTELVVLTISLLSAWPSPNCGILTDVVALLHAAPIVDPPTLRQLLYTLFVCLLLKIEVT